MRKSAVRCAVGAVAVVGLLAVSCRENGDMVTGPTQSGPFRLTFSLDASFQGPHGGQAVNIAVIRASDRMVVARGSGTVSATQNPSFSFMAGAVMQRGVTHEVHYWIDSNFGGGTAGSCDARSIDHQWSTEILSPSNDVALTVSHNPALTEDVCGTFT